MFPWQPYSDRFLFRNFRFLDEKISVFVFIGHLFLFRFSHVNSSEASLASVAICLTCLSQTGVDDSFAACVNI